MRVGGIVLCGGLSTRMGRPKAWLPVGSEMLLPRVVRVLGEVVEPVIVVAANGQDLPPLPPTVEVVRDEEDGRGPLQGLVAGLKALQGRADAAYLSACDVPFLSSAFVRRVIEGLTFPAREQAVVPRIAGRVHPLAAVYATSVLPLAAAELAVGRLRMTDLFALFPTHFLSEANFHEADPQLLSLRNVNTPAEYEAILRDTRD